MVTALSTLLFYISRTISMGEDTDHTLPPLRISKAPQQNRSLLKSPLSHGPPYAIPRRSSSFAIRAKDFPTASITASQLGDSNAQKTPRVDGLVSNPLFVCGQGDSFTASPHDTVRESNLQYDSWLTNGLQHKTNADIIRYDTHDTPEQSPFKSGIFSRLFHTFDPRPQDPSRGIKGNQSSGLLNQLSTSLIPQISRSMSHGRTSSTSTSIGESDLIYFTPDKARKSAPRQRTPPLVRPTLEVPRNRRKTGARFPSRVPITTANLDLLADIQDIDDENDLPLWLTVEIAAAVGIDQCLDSDTLLSLDVVIVVDNLWVILSYVSCPKTKKPSRVTTSAASLKDVYDNALILANETVNHNDCVAICGIYDHNETGLMPFLPLGKHNFDLLKQVFDSIPYLGPRVDRSRQSDLERALREATNMLIQLSNRGALCHVFLVTADSTLRLPKDVPHVRIQIHTVSPDPIFGSGPSSKLNGFHLAYGTYFGDNPIAKQAQTQKVDWLFKQLRTGYDPGALSDLTLNLTPGDGYVIESVLGDTTCKALRPGEKWDVIVKIRGPHQSTAGFGYNSDRIDDLMDQLFKMLEASPPSNDTILSASLEYRHSCLPNAAIVKIERNWEAPQTSRLDACHAGCRSTNECGSVVSVNSKVYAGSPFRGRSVKPRDYLDPLDEGLDDRPLEYGDPGNSEGHASGSCTGSSKSLLPSKIPSSLSLHSKPRFSLRQALGDATNKGRSNGNEQNNQSRKSPFGMVNDMTSTLENRKLTKEFGQKFTNHWLTMEAEDMPEMAQHEWHDVGWY